METQTMLGKIRRNLMVPGEEINVGNNERIISVAAGMFIGILALRNIRKGGYPLLAPAGYLFWRGATGYCYLNALIGRNTASGVSPFEFNKSVIIAKEKSEIYNYWRDLENLPHIMKHIHKVERINDRQYHWEAIFNNQIVSWDALITEDVPNEKISWHSLESADVQSSGTVEFLTAPGDQGTELRINMNYLPTDSELGKFVASFFNPIFRKIVKADLKEFKRNMESGEILVNKPFIHV